jgi:hypothetical protein
VKHCTEDELVLYFYGESRRQVDVERHLGDCMSCAGQYRAIRATLSMIAEPEAPDRGDRYGLEVWQRIRHQLPPQDPSWLAWFRWNRLAAAGAAAAFFAAVSAAFIAGRIWPRPEPAPTASTRAAVEAAPDADARALTAAVSDHLERSERVLLDLTNSTSANGGRIDVSEPQAWAADLIDANRLYRQAATRAGDTTVATVLDDLERNLLDIVHGPSTLTPAQLEQMRMRLDAAALLFKVRVLHDELRERESAPAPLRKTT